MSYSALPLSLARAFQPQVDPDEMERKRRLASLTPPDEGVPARALSGIIAPPDRLYGGDSSLPTRAVQGGDSSLPAMNAPSRAIQPAVAPASPNTIPMSALRAPTPADGQTNFERITTPQAAMPAAESSATRISTPPGGMHVDLNARPMSAIQLPDDGMGYGNVRAGTPDASYANLTNEGPQARRAKQMAEAGPQPAHGWGRVGRVLLQLGMGNPVGAIAEGVAPGFTAKQRFYRHDLPQAEQAAQVERGGQEEDLQRRLRVEGQTGQIYGTNQPTEPARLRAQKQQEVESQHDIANALREQTNTIAQQRANTGDKSANARIEYGNARLKQHQQGLDNGSHQLVKGMTGDGKVGWFSVNRADASDVVQVADANGQPLQTPDAMLEGGRNYRAAQAQAGANQRAANAQAGADHRAGGRNDVADSAYQRLVTEGKINPDTGLAENPSWRSAYESAFNSQKEHMGADDETAKKKATAFANSEVKAGQYIPYTKLPEFQGYKGAAKAKRSQSRAGQSAAPVTGSITQEVYDAMVKEKGEARTKAYMAKRGLTIRN